MNVRVKGEMTGFSSAKASRLVKYLALGMLLVGCSKAVDDAKEKMGDAAEGAKATAEDAAKSVTDALGQEFTAATEKATSALEGIDGGGEIVSKISGLFTSAHDAVADIADDDAAQAAAGKLDDLTKEVDGLAELTSKLPEEARTAVSGLIEQGIAQLRALTDKLESMPAINNVVKPKLDELIDKLTSL